ncbi:MAG: (d)CMP kinase [Halobacteriales archaeon]
MAEESIQAPLVDSNLFVTVSGPPGCGATTLCDRLSEAMDCPYVSGGQVFRELAADRDISLNQLTAKAEESDEIDRAIDGRLRSIAEKWGAANKAFILESRLAGWVAGNRADMRIWLDAPEEIREERIRDREETIWEMRVREVSEAGRYESYYEINIENREFYDLQLNTGRWAKEAVFGIVRSAIEAYDPADDEGAFSTDPPEV